MALFIISFFSGFIDSAEGKKPKQPPSQTWTTYERPAEYGVVKETNIPITMRDGTVLYADVYFPAAENGEKAKGKFPVILTQMPYNKLVEYTAPFLVERGYIQVVADVRGTGHSQGAWKAFSESEQRDGYDLVTWTATQEWSDGNVGLWGPSYMAINQIFTAALQPPGLKAIFPIVPMADSYRDIAFSGGQVNTGFLPMWIGLVTATGLIPPTYTLDDPFTAVTTLVTHAGAVTDFPLNALSSGLTGGDFAYDGSIHRSMSPISVIDKVKVPAFISGGLHDIFQRGTPLLYERLKQNNVPTKLLMGNWTHGDFGSGLPADGVPNLDQIALRWFDHYLKGIDTKIEEIPDVTQFVLGEGVFKTQPGWPHSQAKAIDFYLQPNKQLATEAPKESNSSDVMIQQPLNGICSGSTNQWLIGMLDQTPCKEDNRLTELTELTYTTDVLDEDLYISGPIGAEIYISTDRKDAVLSVRVTDVSPDGKSTELTAGWLAASFRALDESKSRFLDGKNIQPWHPYTRESVLDVTSGEVMKLNVEIFPTNAVIKKGHKLRIAVGPSDFPHALSPLPQLSDSIGGRVSIYHSDEYPSHVTLPVVPKDDEKQKPGKPPKKDPPSKQPGKDPKDQSPGKGPKDEPPGQGPNDKQTKVESPDQNSKPHSVNNSQHNEQLKQPTESTKPKQQENEKAEETPMPSPTSESEMLNTESSGNSEKLERMARSSPERKASGKQSNESRVNQWWAAVNPNEELSEDAINRLAVENSQAVTSDEAHADSSEMETETNEVTINAESDDGELNQQDASDKEKSEKKSKTVPIIIGLLAVFIPVALYFFYFT